MYIKRIKIENFRSIKSFEFEFSPYTNILCGVNGSGKTSILKALDILFSWFSARIRSPRANGTYLKDEDIRHREKYCFLELTLDNDVTWSLYKQHSRARTAQDGKSNLKELNSWVNSEVEKAHFEETYPIPLYHYFPIHRRSIAEVPKRIFRKYALGKFDVYNPKADSRFTPNAFFSWYREREDIENEQRHWNPSFVSDHQLTAVREATSQKVSGYSGLRIRRPYGFVIDKDEQMYFFESLSDGEKAYYMLLADIARLLAMSHPNPENSPLKAKAVILIDEIDLHLHPKWQREVLPNLRTIFPHCQFVLTTHSPYVLSSADKDSLLLTLEAGEGKIENSVYGAEVSQILLNTLGADSLRAEAVQRKITEIWGLLKDGKVGSPDLQDAIESLRKDIDRNDPELSRIALEEKLLTLNSKPNEEN